MLFACRSVIISIGGTTAVSLLREKIMKHAFKEWAFSLTLLTVASFIRAFSTHCFVLPNNFAPGGFTAISVLLEYGTGFSAAYSIFLLNIPAIIFAFLCLNRNLAIKSTVVITLNATFMTIFRETNFFVYAPEERILAALAGGFFFGVSLALALKAGGSFGGTDVFGIAIQRKFSTTNVAYFIMMLDSSMVLVSFFVYNSGLTPVILALTTMFVQSKVCDMIANGTHSAIRFEVVTSKPEELATAVMNVIHRGVTKLNAVGMYTHEEHSILICILRPRQVTAFRKLIKEIDPDAFAYISQASEVLGKGFRRAN